MIHTIGLPGEPEMFFILLILSPIAISFIALVDILRHEFEPKSNKLVWVLVTLLLPYLDGILYFVLGRNSRVTTKGA